MRRVRFAHVAVAAIVAIVAVWLVLNTEWGDVSLPSPLRGEAARNPFYAAERLVATLGGTADSREALGDTSTAAVVVLSTWGWDIDDARRLKIESWVESGGRLVVDAALVSGGDAFELWSGIARERVEPSDDEAPFESPDAFDPCRPLFEISYESAAAAGEPAEYEVCNLDLDSWLVSSGRLLWALGDDEDLQVVRVAVGEGTVTVVNGVPFRYREIFAGDHGPLLAAAADLRVGDHVVFVSEENATSLLELVWLHGAPVVVVLGVWISLALWRNVLRFGPLEAPAERARRSLGEQVLGTGRFIARVGGGSALHAAASRAVHEAAARRVASYERLSSRQQTEAVARLAGVDVAAFAAALGAGGARSSEQRGALALLESVRRQLIVGSHKSKHGKRI